MKGAPGVYRSISGRYEIAYRDSDGRLRFKTVGRSLEEAKAARAEIVARKARGERVAPSRRMFVDFSAEWFEREEAKATLRPRTLSTYRNNYDRHIEPALRRKRLSEIDVLAVERLIDGMRQKYAPYTIRGTLTVLSRIMARAAKERLVPANPVSQLDRGERPPAAPKKARRALDTAEVEKLLAAAGAWKPMIVLGLFCGLRIGEVLGLQWRDVDFDEGFLRVERQLGQDRQTSAPKTDAAVRRVVLMPEVARTLREHRMRSPYKRPTDFVFPAADGRGRDHRATSRAITRLLTRAGIAGASFHCLRHSFGSHLYVKLGKDALTVAAQMGHSDPRTTLRHYAHLVDKDEAAKRLREEMSAAYGGLVATSS